MIPKPALLILIIMGFSLASHAQEKEPSPPVQIRAVLHDPIRPVAELYYPDVEGTMQPLRFRPKSLTAPILMLPVDGTLMLHDTATIDPEKPLASVAASIKLPADLKRAILVVLPAPPNSKVPYRLLVIDDSEKGFPKGESRVLSLIGVKSAVQAGEHKIPLEPGAISRIPSVKNVNDYHMAQTNFYYQQGESWIPFTERQLQYIDACRRLFIIHATPGALQPTITTIVDTNAGA